MSYTKTIFDLRTIRAYWSKRRVVPPVLFRTNYYSIEILHGVTAIILTYHPHHAKLQVLHIWHLVGICLMLHIHRWDLLWLDTFCRQHLCCMSNRSLPTRQSKNYISLASKGSLHWGPWGYCVWMNGGSRQNIGPSSWRGCATISVSRRVFDVGLFLYSLDLCHLDLWHHNL